MAHVEADQVDEPQAYPEIAALPGWAQVAALRAQALSPAGMEASLRYLRWVRESSLPAELRELAILQVAQAMRSEYEWAHHVEIGLSAGLAERDILAIASDTVAACTHLTGLQRAVLAATRRVVQAEPLDPVLVSQLRAGLSDPQFVDLIKTVSYYTAIARTLIALDVRLESAYQTILQRFPIAA